jgi:hypothetical protein
MNKNKLEIQLLLAILLGFITGVVVLALLK